ncbi:MULTISPECIES: hypothetical protein [Methylococcus]|uniref:Uncharacterized protein n=1 Tax=Methylococcus capsulatus TaxID=414 RepID=A0ABZ2F2Z2_METCP|nr:hypothetical protein [Methylococcus sp. BF19-07]
MRRPTKLTIDPQRITSPEHAEIAQQVGEIRMHATNQILSYVVRGDVVRTFRMTGHAADAIRAIGGNELKARVLVQLIDRFEYLICQGFGLTAALYELLDEGWLIKIENFETVE